MTACAHVRYARRAAGITQRELARRTGSAQPRIAEVEAERTDARASTIERLLAATGHRLVVLPSRATTAAETAEAVREALKQRQENTAFREVIQLSDDLAASQPAIRLALVAAPPATTGDERFDALIAGLVEYRLSGDALPLPEWVADPARRATTSWFVDATPGTEDLSRAQSPAPFSRRNVFLDATELASV